MEAGSEGSMPAGEGGATWAMQGASESIDRQWS